MNNSPFSQSDDGVVVPDQITKYIADHPEKLKRFEFTDTHLIIEIDGFEIMSFPKLSYIMAVINE